MTIPDYEGYHGANPKPPHKAANAFMTGPDESKSWYESMGSTNFEWLAVKFKVKQKVKEVHVYFRTEHLYTEQVTVTT